MADHRWTQDRAQAWSDKVGWLVGCNFAPSTAGNQLEMWQADTFDLATFERELSWAAGLGMNIIRLYLHDLVFAADGDAFLDRIDQVLGLADAVGIGVMPVLFDGVWHPEPALGRQPEPTPRLHNSIWLQSPGSAYLYEEERWDELRPYVDAVLGRFGNDPRVIVWDLFNEPDQLDRDTIISGSRDRKAAAATALCDRVFDWAQEAAPSQPLTVGVWEWGDDNRVVPNDLNRLALERSDIVSFHCYDPAPKLEAVIDGLAEHGRPMLCTEWLARTAGSTVDLLEVFASRDVGAINWGLVDGRTQTRFPWKSWTEPMDDDEPWFHELLHVDGRPYDKDEVALFQRLAPGG